MEDMLSVSRREEDRLQGKPTRFKLSAIITEVIRQFEFDAKQEILMTGELQQEITADKVQIGQIIANILRNAVKYAPGSAKIQVHISRQEQGVKVAITDFGPGIPADVLPYIFDRYYRGGHSMLQISGLGLGLFVAKEIIVRHGGWLGVESTLGQGSTFWFILPAG